MIVRWLALIILPLVVLSCGEEGAGWSAPPQQWQGIGFRIETRPTEVSNGMNEFLVIASRQQHGFINDLVVHIRTTHSRWKQAIPDGALGVFRRALPVKDRYHDQLFVRIERNGHEGLLRFDLMPTPPK
ncbi:MAG: hypothetical protein Q9M13_01065 [Mariprofundales bacterium]|nr:hypothetical protein [Mariprofundales bacterium]